MLLEREQIQRYMRQIIMTEIGGAGQKKLLEASVMIYCDNLSNSEFMLYYLTAMGIGKLNCYAKNAANKELLIESLQRLNPFTEISISSEVLHIYCNDKFDATIVSTENAGLDPDIYRLKNMPIILIAAAGDCGYLKTVIKGENLGLAINEINSFYSNVDINTSAPLFSLASSSLLGSLGAIEIIKVLLSIGCPCESTLQFDLADYSFVYGNGLKSSYKYSISADNINCLLKEAKVLIVGSGGLGSPTAYMLTLMGIGKLGLVDYDTVEISNLNRQILHTTDSIGISKVKSAENFLKRLNPQIEICTYETRFSLENAEELIKAYDIVVDGLDNLPNRYLLNDVCYSLKKPLIEAGVLGFNGLATAIIADKGPCYRCIFPENADSSPVPACSETGVLGAVPGVMGIIQAIEILKHISGIGVPLVNKILMFDALNMDITTIDIFKEPTCALCSDAAAIHAPKNYEFICNSK